MKTLVLIGGPNHNEILRTDGFPTMVASGLELDAYRFAFGDDYVGIYYWRLNDFQAKAIQKQIAQLRAHYREIEQPF